MKTFLKDLNMVFLCVFLFFPGQRGRKRGPFFDRNSNTGSAVGDWSWDFFWGMRMFKVCFLLADLFKGSVRACFVICSFGR